MTQPCCSMKQFRRTVSSLLQRLVELMVHTLLSFVYSGPGKQMAPIDDLLLLNSATGLAQKIRMGKTTSVEVVETFIKRIKEINPILNCLVDQRFEAAIEDAKAADKLIQSGSKTEQEIARDTPFLGVPFTTKDCLKVKGLCHTAGIYARKDVKADTDSESIALMRKAGGIPLGVTNVSECGMWWESNNPVFGRTMNPYNTHHIAGGSSGGEGSILAAAGSPIGIGSDVGGSIRMPAFFNGVFGHKPSRDIVSNDGQYPVPSSADQNGFLGVGPMSRFATDLLPTLKVIAGTKAAKLKLDEKVDICKLKYYYMEDDGGSPMISRVDPEIKAALHKVVLHLDKAYSIKAQKVNIAKLKNQAPVWFARMKDKEAPPFAEWLTNRKGSINVFVEFTKWVFGLSKYTFIAILTALTENLGVQWGTPKHAHLVDVCKQIKQEFEDMLGEDGVFLYPTHPTPAPYHNEPIIKPFNFAYTGIFNVLGFPATHCPLGLHSTGLPIGIQVVGGENKDRLCLAVALEMERAFGGWVPPRITV